MNIIRKLVALLEGSVSSLNFQNKFQVGLFIYLFIYLSDVLPAPWRDVSILWMGGLHSQPNPYPVHRSDLCNNCRPEMSAAISLHVGLRYVSHWK